MYIHFVKRLLDIFLSILAMPVFLAAMGLIAIVIKCDDPSAKIIFPQCRSGKDGENFTIYKFRTMTPDTPPQLAANQLTPESYNKYVTKVGKVLRKFSLDELPQIFNILKGDMSIVGPRPLVVSETELLNARKKNGVHLHRPGLTGWAQVKGRNNLSDNEKLAYDIEYCNKVSFFFDLKCLIRTIPIVITGFLGGNDRIDPKGDFAATDELVVGKDDSILTYPPTEEAEETEETEKTKETEETKESEAKEEQHT